MSSPRVAPGAQARTHSAPPIGCSSLQRSRRRPPDIFFCRAAEVADLRYFRAYGFKLTDLQTAGLALDRFDFWRASIGLAAKF
jgi:hypothetical protein